MSQDKEPAPKPKYSEAAQEEGKKLYSWLYGQVAEGYGLDVDIVRAHTELDHNASYEELRAPYAVAIELNEKHRAELPADIEEDKFAAQVGVHEDIAFLLWDAETALAQDQGLFD